MRPPRSSLGLAAQQTLGNVFAGVVLQSTRPFRVGERVRLTGGPMARLGRGNGRRSASSTRRSLKGQDRMMIPNNLLLLLAVEPLREPGFRLIWKARFDSHLGPATVQRCCARRSPCRPCGLPHRAGGGRQGRSGASNQRHPVNPSDGARLAEQVVSVTRGTFEYEKPDPEAIAREKGRTRSPTPMFPTVIPERDFPSRSRGASASGHRGPLKWQ